MQMYKCYIIPSFQSYVSQVVHSFKKKLGKEELDMLPYKAGVSTLFNCRKKCICLI